MSIIIVNSNKQIKKLKKIRDYILNIMEKRIINECLFKDYCDVDGNLSVHIEDLPPVIQVSFNKKN